jgi:hypothetical protein
MLTSFIGSVGHWKAASLTPLQRHRRRADGMPRSDSSYGIASGWLPEPALARLATP